MDIRVLGEPQDDQLSPARSRTGRSPLTGMRHSSLPWWRDRLRRRFLAFADALTAVGFAVLLSLLSDGDFGLTLWALVAAPAWILLAKLHGLYDRDHRVLRHLTVDELPALLGWALSSVVLSGVVVSATPAESPSLRAIIGAFFVTCGTALVLRGSTRWLWRRVTPAEQTVIVGEGPLADETRRKLELFPDIHAVLTGQLESLSVERLAADSSWLGQIDRVILAGLTLEEGLISELIARCREQRTKLSVVPPVRGRFGTAVKLSHVADLPLVEYNTWDVSRSTMLIKRVIDIVVSGVLLVVLAPVGLLIVFAIIVDDRGPVFFLQRRSGLGGRTFQMVKFRTMVADAERYLPNLVQLDKLPSPMFKLRDDPRVTRIGRVLRRCSLDEIPQFINVLHGEMSLVGPRPEQVELVERYEREHTFRLLVKPGMTGPMQVFGRGELSFAERLSVEREYVENLSVARDLRIIALTFSAMLRGGGAY